MNYEQYFIYEKIKNDFYKLLQEIKFIKFALYCNFSEEVIGMY